MNILLLFRKQMMIIKIKWAKLTKMIQYTKTKKCLEATIVHYFEPNARLEECGQCSNCIQQNKTYDMTNEAK